MAPAGVDILITNSTDANLVAKVSLLELTVLARQGVLKLPIGERVDNMH